MNELFFRECRAAGIVFKTSEDWFKWLTDNGYDIKKPVAEHDGFKFNINDACINPHVYAAYEVDNHYNWKVKTAKTQFGWIWGYDISTGNGGSVTPAVYPSRYDISAIFYETEEQAAHDALSFIIRHLEWKPKAKNNGILLLEAKKKRADIVHPQMELFK